MFRIGYRHIVRHMVVCFSIRRYKLTNETYLIKFLNSRKSENTKKHVEIILEYLSGENKGKRIRLKDIKDALVPGQIKDATTFHRTINDLAAAEIIERTEEPNTGGGRPAVYFRLGREFNPISYLTRRKLEEYATKLEEELKVAKSTIKQLEEQTS